jgi:hypothetical protein
MMTASVAPVMLWCYPKLPGACVRTAFSHCALKSAIACSRVAEHQRVSRSINKWAAPFATKDAACCGPSWRSRVEGDSFQAQKSGNSAVQTYTRISAVGREYLTDAEKIHSTTINKPNDGEEPRWWRPLLTKT